ncbi:MAG: SphA family protein [Woeseiaceae bacterium]
MLQEWHLPKTRVRTVSPRLVSLSLLATALIAFDSIAAEGGYSNYVAGSYGDFGMALMPSENWTLRNDFYFYDASVAQSVRSGNIEIGADLSFAMNFTTLLYKPDVEIFGAQYAAGIFVPIVDLDLDASLSISGMTRSVSDSATGLGDVALIPFAFYWQTGNLHMSFAEFIVTPTGDYDLNNLINKGLNYWSFDTNFALTYLDPEKGRDLSFNVGYIYNTENDDTDYQTGQELHVDVVFNQFLSETFAIGLHGFYLKQITGDSGSGALLGDFKADASGIGPALLWSTKIGGQDVSFVAKWLSEIHAENRLEGDHIYLSFALDW